MRRVALLLVFILSVTIFTYPTTLENQENRTWSTSSSSLDIIVLDNNGLPLSGAVVTVTDAWTGLTVAGPETLPGSRLVFDNLPAGPMRITVTHSNYASGMGFVILFADDVFETDVALIPLDGTLNISGTAGSDITLTLIGHTEELQTTLNASGNSTLAVPNGGSGWVSATNDNGASLISWSGEDSIAISDNGSMRIFGWPENASDTGILRIEHQPSGYWELVEWSGEVDENIPRTAEGEWRIYNSEGGIRIGQPITSNDSAQLNITSLLTNQDEAPSPKWEGHAYLNMTSAPEKGETFNLTWEASFTIPTDFGSPHIPDRSLGLIGQIDRWFGNRDGNLGFGEQAGFSMFHGENMWVESNHLFLFDEQPLNGLVNRSDFSITQNESIGAGYYSWNETAALQGEAAFGSSRIFWFPVRGDALESIPITVNLPSGWEVRYSPQIDLLTGNQSTFTVNRSLSPTVGMWTVTVGPNQAPIAEGHLEERPGLAIPMSGNVTLTSECSDSGMSELSSHWELRKGGESQVESNNESFTFIPENVNYSHSNVVNATLTCSDWDGASSNWWIDLYVDGEVPMANINATEEAGGQIPPYFHFLGEVGEFEVRAGSLLTVIAETEDDSGAGVNVIWRSNKSEGWEQHDIGFADQFNQGNDVNWMHMSVEERHLQRELTVYSLEMELIDGAGNSNVTSWNVTMLDGTPPTITAEVMVDGNPIGPLNPAMGESEIILNLTRSFDDIDGIENTVWAIFLDNIPLLTNGTWDEARIFQLPQMNVGTHELKLYAMDSSGNIREVISNPVVEPQVPASISGVEINVNGTPFIGDSGMISVTIVNIGSTNAKVTACYHEQCSREWDSGEATADRPATVILPLEVSEFNRGEISVEVTWTDQVTGEGGTFTIESDISPKSPWTEKADEIIAVILLSLFGFLMYRNRPERDNTPF